MKCIGAYVLRGANDEVLYVGSSGDIAARSRQHAARVWWADVARIDVRPTATRDDAFALEARLIRELNPLHNIVRPRGDAPRRRPRVTPPFAFLGDVRASLYLTLEDISERATARLGYRLSPERVADIETGCGGTDTETEAVIASVLAGAA